MDYPHRNTYERLYARYLQPARTMEMLQWLGPLQGLHVLDLCGGGGRASLRALRLGASSATLVDESAAMAPPPTPDAKLQVSHQSVEDFLDSYMGPLFDGAVCQQAINYWLRKDLVEPLREKLKPGARFVFNTFWQKPATKPTIKNYSYAGLEYTELSWLSSERTIEHVQVCEGMAPHTTRFSWIEPHEFVSWMSSCFDVTEHRDKKTSIFVCTAR